MDKEIIEKFEKISGGKPVEFEVPEDFQEDDFPQVEGLTVEGITGVAKKIVEENTAFFTEKGYQLFSSDNNFGYGKDKMSVILSKEQFDILRAMRCNGLNYDISTNDVIEKL